MLDFISGEILLVDKPYGWTSFDAVNKIKYALKPLKLKVGHSGTLDPLAIGLLVICTGKKTKEIEGIQSQIKEYTGKFYIGKTTPSFDLETEPNSSYPTEHITSEKIEEARNLFLGKISQTPPVYSAIKINGKRAYESARKGQDVEIKPRMVEIYEFDIDTSTFPEVKFRILCSKGTYIRSIANDFGVALESGAYLSELRRTRIGDFNISDALSIEKTVELIKSCHESLS